MSGISDFGRKLAEKKRKSLGAVGQFMVRSTKRNFSEERGPDGKPWARLRPMTIAKKGHDRILFESGGLNRAVSVISLDDNRVSVGVAGVEADKGLKHQMGKGSLPARPFLGFSEPRNDRQKIRKMIVQRLRA